MLLRVNRVAGIRRLKPFRQAAESVKIRFFYFPAKTGRHSGLQFRNPFQIRVRIASQLCNRNMFAAYFLYL